MFFSFFIEYLKLRASILIYQLSNQLQLNHRLPQCQKFRQYIVYIISSFICIIKVLLDLIRYLTNNIDSIFLILVFKISLPFSMQKIQARKVIKDYIYNETKVLGSGSTGSVYKGYQINTGNHLAIKVIDLQTIDNQVSEYLLLMEKNALMMVSHPNILKGIDMHQQNGHCYLVTEYCNGGTLKDLIQKQGKLSQHRSLEILENILKGYSECVRKKIVHRDLKPANIMIHNGQCKIIDFGYCTIEGFKKPKLQYNVGSPSYMAPESYKWNMYNQKTEIWAIGVTFYECVTGKTLDQGRKMSDTFKELLEVGIYFPEHLSERCKKVIEWCLQYDPKRRPNCVNLLNSVSQIRKETSQSSTQNSQTQNLRKTPSQSFLYSTPPSSVRNLSFYNNYTNQNQTPSQIQNSSQTPSQVNTPAGQSLKFRQSNFKDFTEQEITRPRFQSKILPETTKEHRKTTMYESTIINPQRNTFLSQNHRLGNYQTGDPYQQQPVQGKIHNQGYASLRNKYNLKIDQTSENVKDFNKLYANKKQLNVRTQRHYNQGTYNNYITPTNYTVSRQPSMTYR